MPNSLDQDIRAALENKLLTVDNLPPYAPEGVSYRPKVGFQFSTGVLIPISERSGDIGVNHFTLHSGKYRVTLVYPQGFGMGDIESMTNKIKETFPAGSGAEHGDISVRFSYAERRNTIHDPDWIRIPIDIGYYLYNPVN